MGGLKNEAMGMVGGHITHCIQMLSHLPFDTFRGESNCTDNEIVIIGYLNLILMEKGSYVRLLSMEVYDRNIYILVWQ